MPPTSISDAYGPHWAIWPVWAFFSLIESVQAARHDADIVMQSVALIRLFTRNTDLASTKFFIKSRIVKLFHRVFICNYMTFALILIQFVVELSKVVLDCGEIAPW